MFGKHFSPYPTKVYWVKQNAHEMLLREEKLRSIVVKVVLSFLFLSPEEAGRLEREGDQSERNREEKQRTRGLDGQRPPIPDKVQYATSMWGKKASLTQ